MWIIILTTLFLTQKASGESFEVESKNLASELKSSLMSNLAAQISKHGVESAIPFCHENVKPIAKEAAKNYLAKFEFGRSSHKLRNTTNKPKDWMQPYIESFVGLKFDKKENSNYGKYGTLPDGKRVYVEPLFIQAQCLSCHGDFIAKNVSSKITELYPSDQAKGFKMNEFRGIIWIEEK